MIKSNICWPMCLVMTILMGCTPGEKGPQASLSLTFTPTIVSGTLFTENISQPQIIWGVFFANVQPDAIGGGGTPRTMCQIFIDNSPLWPQAGARLGYPQEVTLSAPFFTGLSAGSHNIDLRCWNDTSEHGVSPNLSEDGLLFFFRFPIKRPL